VFLGEKLAPVARALEVSTLARKLMRENLWIAVVYNLIAVPLAIAGYVTPLIAALAMSGSSLIVTINALRAGRTPDVERDASDRGAPASLDSTTGAPGGSRSGARAAA
jgi:Cu2+-exporting ATPase